MWEVYKYITGVTKRKLLLRSDGINFLSFDLKFGYSHSLYEFIELFLDLESV